MRDKLLILLFLTFSVHCIYGQTEVVERSHSNQNTSNHQRSNHKKTIHPVFKSESFLIGNLMYETINTKEVIVYANKESKPEGEIIIPEVVSYKGKDYKVTHIGYEAFRGCNSLYAVSIPSSIVNIDNYAFLGTKIEKINIPASVKDINQFTLYGIKESINVDERNRDYSSVNGVLYNKDKSILYLWPPKNSVGSKLVIPRSVRKVYDQAFWYTEFSSVTLSPEIDYWIGCFNYCTIDTLVILENSIDPGYSPFNCESKIRMAIISSKYEKEAEGIFDHCNNVDMYIINYPDGKKDYRVNSYIDLGLPSGTLWAKFNVGAKKPEEFGNYFAWGETCPKEIYSVSNYKWGNSRVSDPTKYNTNVWPVKGDDKRILDLEDDAAYVNWGDKWCLPSISQVLELKRDCHWTWTVINGVNGYEVKGPNGNSIFLPASGIRGNEKQSIDLGVKGNYWTRELCSGYNHRAYSLQFEEAGKIDYDENYRDDGLSIRPVQRKK